METKTEPLVVNGLRIILLENHQEVARARLYFLSNDLHQQPFAYLEDVFVKSEFRGKGFGSKLIQLAISEAQKQKCYKIVATSRFSNERAQKLYLNAGFEARGKSFRLDLGRE